MIVSTSLYRGQGLGNQLWLYAVCRTLALDLGADFSIRGRNRFKGHHLFTPDFGVKIKGPVSRFPSSNLPEGFFEHFQEKKSFHPESRQDITEFDPKLLELRENTVIDGNFESEKYISHRKPEIAQWFKSRIETQIKSNVCVINFRGGEMAGVPEAFLPPKYYEDAMSHIRDFNSEVEFEVVTDDPELASRYFDSTMIRSKKLLSRKLSGKLRVSRVRSHRQLAFDFSRIQQARYLILSNSSFSWWGGYTNTVAQHVIAPQYWLAHNANAGYWSPGSIHTSGWLWLDRAGVFSP
jgi:hypothetical protein